MIPRTPDINNSLELSVLQQLPGEDAYDLMQYLKSELWPEFVCPLESECKASISTPDYGRKCPVS